MRSSLVIAFSILLFAATGFAESRSLNPAGLRQDGEGSQLRSESERKLVLRPHFGLAIKKTEFNSGYDWEANSYVQGGWGADLGVNLNNRFAAFAGITGMSTKENWRTEYTIMIHDGPSYTETIKTSTHSLDHFLYGTVRYTIVPSYFSPYVQLGLIYHLERVVNDRFGVMAAVGTILTVSKTVRFAIEVRMIHADASPGPSGLEHEQLNSIFLTILPEIELFSF